MNSVIVFCAQYLFVLVILLIAIAWLKESRDAKIRFIGSAIVAGVIAYLLSRIASKLLYDPRPFVVQHVKPLFPHAPDNGFPSDHALFTGFLTGITFFFSKKFAIPMLLLTIIIGAARVTAKVHSWLDISGGWILGAIGAVAGYYLFEWYWRNHKPAFAKHRLFQDHIK